MSIAQQAIAARFGFNADLVVTPGGIRATQAKQALMIAGERGGAFSYTQVLNMEDANMVKSAKTLLNGALTMPKDNAQYYLGYAITEKPYPVVLAEAAVIGFLDANYALTVAAGKGLLTYVRPADPLQRNDVADVRKILADPKLSLAGPDYHFLVTVDGAHMLLATADVLAFACDLAALADAQTLGVLQSLPPADFQIKGSRERAAEALGHHPQQLPSTGQFCMVALGTTRLMIPVGTVPETVLALAVGQGHPRAGELSYHSGMLAT